MESELHNETPKTPNKTRKPPKKDTQKTNKLERTN